VSPPASDAPAPPPPPQPAAARTKTRVAATRVLRGAPPLVVPATFLLMFSNAPCLRGSSAADRDVAKPSARHASPTALRAPPARRDTSGHSRRHGDAEIAAVPNRSLLGTCVPKSLPVLSFGRGFHRSFGGSSQA
jgi:hypothetical protein